MNKRIVLFVCHEATVTGAPLILFEVMQFLAESGDVSPYIVVRENNGSALLERFRQLGPTWCIWEPRPRGWPVRFDLVYSNTITNGVFIEDLELTDTPVITHVHELTNSIYDFGRNNLAAVLRHTTRFVACSSAVRHHLVHNFGINANAVDLIPSFFSPERILELKGKRDGSISGTIERWADDFVIGAAGWASNRKGTDFFLRLANLLPAKIDGRNLRLVWVGGNAGAFIENIPPSLRHRIDLLGVQQNPIPLYERFDIFAMTSREDPFPLVVLENAYLSRPMIGFAGSGGFDEFATNSAALAVPMLDEDRFAASIVMLLKCPALASDLGNRAKNLSLRYIAKDTLPHFVSLLGSLHDRASKANHSPLPHSLLPHLEARLTPFTRGTACLYFGPSEEECIRIEFDRSAAAHFHFTLPVDASGDYLRFDPDASPGIFMIEKILVSDSSGHEVLRQDPVHGWSRLGVGGTAFFSTQGETLCVTSFGNDPQVSLPKIESEARQFSISILMRTAPFFGNIAQ